VVPRASLGAAVFLSLLFFVISGCRAYAQGNSPPPQNVSFTVEGKITEASPGKMTIDSGQNMLFEVRYDAKTNIQRDDGSTAKASDFRKGVEVKVAGDLTEAGDVIAKKIVIVSHPKGSST
jgi:hypothetical protein